MGSKPMRGTNSKGYMMVKVLIYSSKEIYDNAPYEGRAEADIVAYRRPDDCYEIVKNRTEHFMGSYTSYHSMARVIKWAERDEFDRELKNYNLAQRYKDHPSIELSKNAEVAQR
jgi:hypothetical protein